jgi:hypothetical protein
VQAKGVAGTANYDLVCFLSGVLPAPGHCAVDYIDFVTFAV